VSQRCVWNGSACATLQDPVVMRSEIPTSVCVNDVCKWTAFNNWFRDDYRYAIRAVASSGTKGELRWTSWVKYESYGVYNVRNPCTATGPNVSNNASTIASIIPTDSSLGCMYVSNNQTRTRDFRSGKLMGIEDGHESSYLEVSAVVQPRGLPSGIESTGLGGQSPGWAVITGVESYTIPNNMFIGVDQFGRALMCAALANQTGIIHCAVSSAPMELNENYFVRGYWLPGWGLYVEWRRVSDPQGAGGFSSGSRAHTTTKLYVNDGLVSSGGTEGIWTGGGYTGQFNGRRHFNGIVQDPQIFRI
jgi:hypothetical protein